MNEENGAREIVEGKCFLKKEKQQWTKPIELKTTEKEMKMPIINSAYKRLSGESRAM